MEEEETGRRGDEGSSLGTVGGVTIDFRPKRGDGGRQEV